MTLPAQSSISLGNQRDNCVRGLISFATSHFRNKPPDPRSVIGDIAVLVVVHRRQWLNRALAVACDPEISNDTVLQVFKKESRVLASTRNSYVPARTAFGRHGRRGVFFRETAPFVTGGPQKSHIQGRKAGHFLQSVWSSISEIGPKWSKRQLTKILFYGTGTRAAGRCKYDHYTVTHASQCRATALKCHGSLLLGYRDHDSRENAHVPVVPCSSQIFTTGDFK